MRMRARKYGIINRSIARSITYSLRNHGKKNSHKTTTYRVTNTNSSENVGCGTAIFIFSIIIIIIFVLVK
jgi:hypothetical protein